VAIVQVDPSRLQLEETTTNTWLWRGNDKGPSPLPTVNYKTTTELPAAIDTLLLPFEGKKAHPARLQVIETGPNGLDSAFKVRQGKVEDLFVLQSEAAEKTVESEKVSFEGQRLFLRKIGGKLRSALLVNGTRLAVGGRDVLTTEKPLSWVAVCFDESAVRAYTSSDEPTLRIPAAGNRKLLTTNTGTDRLIRAQPRKYGKLLTDLVKSD